MIRYVFLAVFSVVLLNVNVAIAQDEAKTEEAPSADEKKAERKDNIDAAQAEVDVKPVGIKEPSPELKKLNKELRDLTIDLSKNDRRHFFMIYNNHNMISTVKYVRDQVSAAIDACSETNPDMEQALRDRYKIWTDAVNEGIKDAEAQRDNMVIAQDYTKASDIRGILRQADGIRDETNDAVESVPVTTPEACEYLLNKMDETQSNMLAILRAALVTLPQAIQSLPDEDEEQAEEVEEESAEDAETDETSE